jgi:hypothetical protein
MFKTYLKAALIVAALACPAPAWPGETEYVLLYVSGGTTPYMTTAPSAGLYTRQQCEFRRNASRAHGVKDIQCVKVERDSGD